MSLRVFHVIFIIVCVAFSLFLTFWGVREWRADGGTTELWVAIISAIAAVALLVYGVKAFRKLRDLP